MNEPTMPADTIARLEQHAFAYRMNGFAFPGADGGKPITEPIWTLDYLTGAERDFLNRRYDELLVRDASQSEDLRARLYARVLETYGIACPHPVYWRRYFRPSAFECQACEHLICDPLQQRA